ncbi:MAG: heavy metal translocating P-type ATPase [Rhodanobacteraceae bacterium]
MSLFKAIAFDRHAWRDIVLLVFSVLALLCGLGLSWSGHTLAAHGFWSASALLLAALLMVESAVRLWHREVGVDLIALLAIGAALAFDQSLVAAVIAVMLAGGRALEAYAMRRAQQAMSRLLENAPTLAWRHAGEQLEQIPVASVVVGDRLFVRAGEIVPVDGDVLDHAAVLDESSLTGESLPVTHAPGARIASGSVNAGAPFDMRAERPAGQSTYAGIIHMVEAARRSRAPLTRLADRYALIFIPLALFVAAAAWLLSGDAIRALAVLVVATPCPLILAAPVAIVGGLSRCARRGILVKGGAALETLATARLLFFDKTGTLTRGRARLLAIETGGTMDADDLLRLAASLAQASTHVTSQNIVRIARERKLRLETPTGVVEEAGAGLRGQVAGHALALGAHAYVTSLVQPAPWAERFLRELTYQDGTGSFVAIDGAMAGAMGFTDQLREDAPRAVRKLRQAGISRIVMLTGDRNEPAQAVAAAVGADDVHARLRPADKLALIARASAAAPTIMVGDGVNDAPALAAAGVGIAIGARGATAATETADVVLLTDRLDRVAEAVRIAHRTRRIALQSILAGMGLSLLAMLAAATGHLPPLLGAILQEAIDVAVILNALRAIGHGGSADLAAPGLDPEALAQIRRHHTVLVPLLERTHDLARRLDTLPADTARKWLTSLIGDLRKQLLPHERDDESRLYPELAEKLGGDDPLAALSQGHREIFRLVRLLERMSADLAGNRASAAPSLREIQRVLYRLDVVLDLHFAQEEELYGNLDDAGGT